MAKVTGSNGRQKFSGGAASSFCIWWSSLLHCDRVNRTVIYCMWIMCVTGPTFRDRCSIPVSDRVADRTRLSDAWQWLSADSSSGRWARHLRQSVSGWHFYLLSVLLLHSKLVVHWCSAFIPSSRQHLSSNYCLENKRELAIKTRTYLSQTDRASAA